MIELWKLKSPKSDIIYLAGVNQDGVGPRGDFKPSAVVLYLQAADAVLYEKREEAVVGMWRHPHCRVRIRTARVQIRDENLQRRGHA